MPLEAALNDQVAVGRRADPYTNRASLEFGFRQKRFAEVQRLIQAILDERGQARILDLGGTETYWLVGEEFIRRNSHRLEITLVNTEVEAASGNGMFRHIEGSATDQTLFAGDRFDLVHSNSVIEHVGDWKAMQDFAANVRRLAPRYYIQTPNFWFPFEPHFRCAGFQYLPAWLRARLIMQIPLGFFSRIASWQEAKGIINHHRLISARQMASLFPGAAIKREKFCGLSKSIIAVCG